MAQTAPVEDTVGDITRESLIAISNTLPEHPSPAADSEKAPEVTDGVNEKEDTTVEDYSRSELISLSYTAPDDEPLPQL